MGWRETYKEHEIWSAAEAAQDKLHELEAEGTLTHGDTRVEQLRDMLADLVSRRTYPEPFVTTKFLNDTAGALANVVQLLPNLDAVTSGPTQSTSAPFDTLARQVRAWPRTSPHHEVASLAAQAEEAQRSAQAAVAHTDAQAKELQELLQQIKTEAADARKELKAEWGAALTELNGKTTALQTASDQATTQVAANVQRLEDALTDHAAAFRTAEEERAKEFSASVQQNDDSAAELLGRMSEHEKKSRTLLEAIGVNATATHYGNYANQQQQAANGWRLAAIAVFTLAAAWFALSFALWHDTVNSSSGWALLIGRWGGTAATAGAGLYAARESGQHRREERSARRVQLVLTALDPFIANMDPEVQRELRKATAEAIFVLPKDAPSGTSKDADASGLAEPIGKAMDVIQDLTKQTR